MRRNARFYNLRRFLSVGLAVAMIASSQPITAYAEDGETPKSDNEISIDNAKDASSDTSTDSTDVKEASKAISEATDGLQDNEKKEVADLVNSLDNVAGILSEDTLNENGEVVENSVKTNVDTATSSMTKGVEKQAKADEIATSASDSFSNYDQNALTDALSNNSEVITDKTASVKDNVIIANESNSKDDAYKAKDDAQSDYDAANNSLEAANTAYTNAKSAADTISANCLEAEKIYKEAEKDVEAAGNALKDASTRMDAAMDELKKAQASLDFLMENNTGLKAIYDQYQGVMVIYYTDILGNNAKYNDDGTLNFDACAEAITAKAMDKEAKSPAKDKVTNEQMIFPAGRYLMVDEVTYMLRNEGAENIQFIAGDKTTYKVDKETGKKIGTGDKLKQERYSDSSDPAKKDGRANSFFVQYTTKDSEGNDVTNTKAFNYIIKNSGDVDEASIKEELKTGAIFIAEIGDNHTPTAVTSDYMYDNYAELDAKINSEDYKKYQKALAEVQGAIQEVNYLQIKINNLKNCVLDKTAYNNYVTLKTQLDAAYAVLEQAEKDKADLEDKVVEAKKALDSIDLSRFNTSSSSSSSSSNPSTGTPATTPVVTTVAQAPVQPANELIVTGPIVTLFDDAVPLTDIPVRNTVKNTNNAKAANKTTDAKDATPKKKAAPKKATVEIAEDEVPLAAAPAENIEEKTENKTVVNNVLPDANDADTAIAWWWWLILVVVAAIITKVSYEINKKSKENKAKK